MINNIINKNKNTYKKEKPLFPVVSILRYTSLGTKIISGALLLDHFPIRCASVISAVLGWK